MNSEEFGGLVGLLVVVGVGYVIPLRLGFLEARKRGSSPHWLWFGIYPFVGWIVWAILRRRPALARCPSCDSPLPSGARFCSVCSKSVTSDAVAQSAQNAALSVSWAKGAVPCAKCSTPLKLASNACSSCGSPTPRVHCPSCGSPKTTTKRDSASIWAAGILLVLSGGNWNRWTNRITGQIRTPETLGEAIEFAVMVLVMCGGIYLIFRGFTWRGFIVRCAACGKKTKPGLSPMISAPASSDTPTSAS